MTVTYVGKFLFVPRVSGVAVHKKIRNIVCNECGYAASGKNNLTSHIKGVHQKNFRLL